ncbi:MAG: Hsp70 family protein, partial [Deltaproteobacteria bacterium]
ALGSGRFPFFSGSLADMLYITVPVGFQDYKRAMKEIMEKTTKGVTIEFIEEPLAAAVGYQVAEERDKVAMLVDFGGSTLDIMVLRLNIDEVHVVAKPDRSKILGGHDIDIWLADFLKRKAGITGDPPPALVLKAEEIKISLSEHKAVPFEWDGVEVCRVTREDLEEVLAEHGFYKVVDRAVSYVLKKAEKVGIRKDVIETVLLTGGSSQIPSFKEKIDHIFPMLKAQNAIYDHDPLSAVARGAALYGTRDAFDRHLSTAYAIRYATKNKDAPFSYEVVLEKGEPLPLEKTFKITHANTLGAQDEMYLELFEVPESLIFRKWVSEEGKEFIKQEIKYTTETPLKGFEIITLPIKESPDSAEMTFCINETGHLKIKYGKEAVELETAIRLQ